MSVDNAPETTGSDEEFNREVVKRIDALGQFETRMGEIAQAHARAPSPGDRRGTVCEALTAVHGLMVAIDLMPAVGPIIEMAAAIQALHEGVQIPLVKPPRRRRGAPATSELDALQRAVVAASVEQRFTDVTHDLGAACSEVARWVVRSSVMARQKNPAGAVRNWRDQHTGHVGMSLAHQVYRHYTARSSSPDHYACPLNTQVQLDRVLRIWGASANPK